MAPRCAFGRPVPLALSHPFCNATRSQIEYADQGNVVPSVAVGGLNPYMSCSGTSIRSAINWTTEYGSATCASGYRLTKGLVPADVRTFTDAVPHNDLERPRLAHGREHEPGAVHQHPVLVQDHRLEVLRMPCRPDQNGFTGTPGTRVPGVRDVLTTCFPIRALTMLLFPDDGIPTCARIVDITF